MPRWLPGNPHPTICKAVGLRRTGDQPLSSSPTYVLDAVRPLSLGGAWLGFHMASRELGGNVIESWSPCFLRLIASSERHSHPNFALKRVVDNAYSNGAQVYSNAAVTSEIELTISGPYAMSITNVVEDTTMHPPRLMGSPTGSL